MNECDSAASLWRNKQRVDFLLRLHLFGDYVMIWHNADRNVAWDNESSVQQSRPVAEGGEEPGEHTRDQ